LKVISKIRRGESWETQYGEANLFCYL